jgi:hypothetical protein
VKWLSALATLTVLFGFGTLQANHIEEKKIMHVKRITPVLLVKEIEPVVPFWVDRLGFTKAFEVPEGGKIVFVAFQKDSTEVMYQTFASVEKDAPPAI